MSDDDLDLGLEDERPRPRRRPQPPPEPQPEPQPVEPVKVAGVRGPGLLQRVSALKPVWDWKTALLLFLALLGLVLLTENLSPVRGYFLGWRLELPKALSFLLSVALGWLLAWLWFRRADRDGESDR